MKTKVLMVACSGLGNGGVQNVMMNLVRKMSFQYAFDMLLFVEEREYYDDEFEKYGNIYRIPNRKSRIDYFIRPFRIYGKLYGLLKSNQYKIIHCNNNFESGICLLAAYMAGVEKRIVHSHETHNIKKMNWLKKPYAYTYKFLLNKFSTHRIACSDKAGEDFFYDYQVILNPIDTEKFAHKDKGSAKKDNINFIHIGKFYELKNQLFIIDVFSRIKETFKQAKITFIGSGDEYLKKMKKRVMELNLNDSVTILPPNSDVPQNLADSDYMIFPSLSEGLPVAMLEAQAMDVFCFASDLISQDVDAGMCVFYSLKYGVEGWAEKIIDFIRNNQKVNYKSNVTKFDIKNVCSQFLQIYTN